MSHQDWNPVVLKKASPKKVVSAPKPKEEKEDGFTEAPRKFSKSFGQSLAQLRMSKEPKMTRKMLAQKLNVTESVVASLETGNENYNPELLSKLKRVLGNFDFKA
jgi:ribosome-binding protein aMBF1 (putative translation factor)